jgi:hypothetical protein
MIIRIKPAAFTVAEGNLTGDFNRQVRYIKALDATCTGLTIQDSPPDIIDTGTQRSNSTDAGYDNTSKFHIHAFKLAVR